MVFIYIFQKKNKNKIRPNTDVWLPRIIITNNITNWFELLFEINNHHTCLWICGRFFFLSFTSLLIGLDLMIYMRKYLGSNLLIRCYNNNNMIICEKTLFVHCTYIHPCTNYVPMYRYNTVSLKLTYEF